MLQRNPLTNVSALTLCSVGCPCAKAYKASAHQNITAQLIKWERPFLKGGWHQELESIERLIQCSAFVTRPFCDTFPLLCSSLCFHLLNSFSIIHHSCAEWHLLLLALLTLALSQCLLHSLTDSSEWFKLCCLVNLFIHCYFNCMFLIPSLLPMLVSVLS